MFIVSPIMGGGQKPNMHNTNPCAWSGCETCRTTTPFDSIFSSLLFAVPSTHLSQLRVVAFALILSDVRCLTTFLYIISVRTTSGLSHFWDYSSDHSPTFLMPFVDRLFLCFGWLQVWKPAKWRGRVQRFF